MYFSSLWNSIAPFRLHFNFESPSREQSWSFTRWEKFHFFVKNLSKIRNLKTNCVKTPWSNSKFCYIFLNAYSNKKIRRECERFNFFTNNVTICRVETNYWFRFNFKSSIILRAMSFFNCNSIFWALFQFQFENILGAVGYRFWELCFLKRNGTSIPSQF